MNKLKILKFVVPTAIVTAVVVPPIVVWAASSNPSLTIEAFLTDPWEDICKYIKEGGINRLCHVYNCKPSDFVSKARKITLNGLEHEVIVLGVEEDTVYGTSNKVTLTFQFNNVISIEEGKSLSTAWGNGDSFNYWTDSIMHKIMNDEADDDITSVYEMIKQSNGWAEANIKPTFRKINYYVSGGWTTGDGGSEKIFTPLISDLFSKTGLENTSDDTVKPGNVSIYMNENMRGGKQYSHYQDKIGDGVISDAEDYIKYDCLKRKTVGDDKISRYWIGPDVYWGKTTIWNASDSLNPYSPGNAVSLAPCFCL